MTSPAIVASLPIGSAPFTAPFTAIAAASSAALKVLSPRDSDAATIQASSELATLPAVNVQSMQPGKVWRTDGAREAYVTLSFAGVVAANSLAIVGHNMSGAGVVRVRLADSVANLTAAPGVDTGWKSAWPATGKPSDAYWPRFLSTLAWSNDSAYGFARIDLADPSATLSYLEVGRLMLCRAWQPTANFDGAGAVPVAFDQRDPQTFTEYGGLFTDRRSRSAPRRMAVAISYTNRREALDGIAEIRRLAGLWGDVVVILDPNATTDFHRLSAQGVFTAPQEHRLTQIFDASGETWTAEIPLREVI